MRACMCVCVGLFEDAALVRVEEGLYSSVKWRVQRAIKIPDKCVNESVRSSAQDLTRLAGPAELTPASRVSLSVYVLNDSLEAVCVCECG